MDKRTAKRMICAAAASVLITAKQDGLIIDLSSNDDELDGKVYSTLDAALEELVDELERRGKPRR